MPQLGHAARPRSGEECSLELDAASYSIACGALGEASQWPQAAEAFLELGFMRIRCDAVAATAALGSLVKSWLWRRSLCLLCRLPRTGVQRNTIAVNAALSTAGKAANWLTAVGLLLQMEVELLQKSSITDGAALSAFVFARSWRRALCQMEDIRQPSGSVASLGLTALAAAGRWAQALAMLVEVLALRLDVDVRLFNEVLGACARRGHWEAALAVLAMLPTRSLAGTVVSFTAAIDACSLAGQWQQAAALLESMAKSEAEANVITFNALIGVCGQGGAWSRGLDLLKEMQVVAVQQDHISTGACALRGLEVGWKCVFVSMWSLELSNLEVVKSLHLHWCVLIQARLKREQAEVWIVRACTAKVSGAARAWMWEEATELVAALPSKQLRSVVIHSAAVCACGDAERWRQALRFADCDGGSLPRYVGFKHRDRNNGLDMTEGTNPVSLDMPMFGDAAWEERHSSSAAGSSSACLVAAPAVAATQIDATHMDMDSSQETMLDPEPPALRGAVFETPPRSRHLSLEELRTPEKKARLRETPESAEAKSSEIRRVLTSLDCSPAASSVASADPYMHAGPTAETSVDRQTAEIPLEQFENRAIHALAELPDEAGHFLALVYQLGLCETEQKGVLLTKATLASAVDHIVVGYKNRFDRARMDANTVRLNNWVRSQMIPERAQCSSVILDIPEEARVPWRPLLVDATKQTRRRGFVKKRPAAILAEAPWLDMTEETNPVSLDMPMFGDAAWEERHSSSAAGSSSACLVAAPAVAATQIDATQMDMDSSQETMLDPEPPALRGAVFETPPRSRHLSLEELRTPEKKVRLRETPESAEAKSSEIRRVLTSLDCSPAASSVASADPYMHAGPTAETSVDRQTAEIPLEQFENRAIHTLAELPDEAGHFLALVYQLGLCETEQKGVLLTKATLASAVDHIVVGYKNRFDRARMDANTVRLNNWMRSQMIPERAQCSSVILDIPEEARVPWRPLLVDATKQTRRRGFVKKRPAAILAEAPWLDMTEETNPVSLDMPMFGDAAWEERHSSSAAGSSSACLVAAPAVAATQIDATQMDMGSSQETSCGPLKRRFAFVRPKSAEAKSSEIRLALAALAASPEAASVASTDPYLHADPSKASVDRQTAEIPLEQFENRAIHALAELPDEAGHFLALVYQLGLCETEQKGVLLTKATLASAVDHIVGGYKNRFDRARMDANTVRLNNWMRSQMIPERAQCSSVILDIPEEARVPWRPLLVDATKQTRRRGFVKKRPAAILAEGDMTEETNPVSLDMPMFGDAAWEERHSSSAAGSSSACLVAAPAVAATQIDATQMDMDSSQETMLDPELRTPEKKVRLRETPESAEAKSSEIRRVLTSLDCSPAASSVASADPYMHAGPTAETSVDRQTAEIPLEQFENRAIHTLAELPDEAGHFLALVYQLGLCETEQKGVLLTKATLASAVHIVVGYKNRFDRARMDANTVRLNNWMRSQMIPERAQCSSVILDIPEEARVPWRPLLVDATKQTRRRGFVKKRPAAILAEAPWLDMTEETNPVSLDMPMFGDAAWEERHSSSAAGSSSACLVAAPAVAATQIDATQMDMDSSQETMLDPEPPALRGAVFETPPRSRHLSLEELRTPEKKVRLRETPESAEAKSSEIRRVLTSLDCSPAASSVASADPYMHAGPTAETSVDRQTAEIPLEQFENRAIHTLAELPDEAGHFLALVYQLGLCETEQKGVLLTKATLASAVDHIVVGYKNRFDRARMDANTVRLNNWMRSQMIPERAQCSSVILDIPEEARVPWRPLLVDATKQTRRRGFVKKRPAAILAEAPWLDMTEETNPVSLDMPMFGDAAWEERHSSSAAGSSSACLVAAPAVAATQIDATQMDMDSSQETMLDPEPPALRGAVFETPPRSRHLSLEELRTPEKKVRLRETPESAEAKSSEIRSALAALAASPEAASVASTDPYLHADPSKASVDRQTAEIPLEQFENRAIHALAELPDEAGHFLALVYQLGLCETEQKGVLLTKATLASAVDHIVVGYKNRFDRARMDANTVRLNNWVRSQMIPERAQCSSVILDIPEEARVPWRPLLVDATKQTRPPRFLQRRRVALQAFLMPRQYEHEHAHDISAEQITPMQPFWHTRGFRAIGAARRARARHDGVSLDLPMFGDAAWEERHSSSAAGSSSACLVAAPAVAATQIDATQMDMDSSQETMLDPEPPALRGAVFETPPRSRHLSLEELRTPEKKVRLRETPESAEAKSSEIRSPTAETSVDRQTAEIPLEQFENRAIHTLAELPHEAGHFLALVYQLGLCETEQKGVLLTKATLASAVDHIVVGYKNRFDRARMDANTVRSVRLNNWMRSQMIPERAQCSSVILDIPEEARVPWRPLLVDATKQTRRRGFVKKRLERGPPRFLQRRRVALQAFLMPRQYEHEHAHDISAEQITTEAASVASTDPYLHADPSKASVDRQTAEIPLEQFENRAIHALAELPDEAGHFLALVYQLGLCETEQKGVLLTKATLASAVDHIVVGYKNRFDRARMDANTVRLNNWMRGQMIPERAQCSSVILDIPEEARVPWRPLLVDATKQTRRRGFVKKRPAAILAEAPWLDMTEETNPVSLDMPMFGDAAWEERHSSSAAGSSSACLVAAPAVAATQIDATQMDMDSSQETMLELRTPEKKVRHRETPESAEAKSSEIRSALAALAASPEAASVASTDPYLHADPSKASVDRQTAEIPLEQFENRAIHALAELPDEAGHFLALVYQLGLCETEQKGVLLTKATLASAVDHIVVGYKNRFDRARMDANTVRLNNWMRSQMIPERAQCSSVILDIPEEARVPWRPLLVDATKQTRRRGFVKKRPAAILAEGDMTEETNPVSLDMPMFGDAAWEERHSSSAAGSSSACLVAAPAVAATQIDATQMDMDSSQETMLDPEPRTLRGAVFETPPRSRHLSLEELRTPEKKSAEAKSSEIRSALAALAASPEAASVASTDPYLHADPSKASVDRQTAEIPLEQFENRAIHALAELPDEAGHFLALVYQLGLCETEQKGVLLTKATLASAVDHIVVGYKNRFDRARMDANTVRLNNWMRSQMIPERAQCSSVILDIPEEARVPWRPLLVDATKQTRRRGFVKKRLERGVCRT
ncbi:MRL1 [Symbiodinium sp. CCMP2592]|nr:MRL1 [Symbiodinium sp. CCMP2592]